MATFTLKKSAAAIIADEKRVPVAATIIGAPVDAKVQGLMFYNECMALTKQHQFSWTSLAHKCFDLSIEARQEFIKHVSKGLKTMREEVANAHYNGDAKSPKAKNEVSSATTQVSRMRKIAEAANKGASMAGLGAFYGVQDPENIGYKRVYEYAQAVANAQVPSKGRPVTLLVSKCDKWLAAVTKNPPANRTEDMAKLDAVFAKKLQALIAEYLPEDAGNDAE